MSAATEALLHQALTALGLPVEGGQRVRLVGADRLPSCFAVTELASAAMAAAGLALSELVAEVAPAPSVQVDHRLASLWFGFSIQPDGWRPAAAWDALAGDYPVQDGWIKLHTNAPHHRAAALAALGLAEDQAPDRAAVAARVADWAGAALEQAVVNAGGCAARWQTRAEWQAHPQGQAVAGEPLIAASPGTTAPASAWRPDPARPLAGIRVLDLTRVLAGPIATRFLAGYGAEVLRIDPPDWDEPGVIPEVTLGKRCARLDLTNPAHRARFAQLLAGADVLVHGYRADALERLGLGAAERQALRPGLIDVSLDAYGHTGPWRSRRGFDSLVQFSTGIAAAGMAWQQAEAPVSLPVQALDHATGYLMAAAAVTGLRARLRGTAQRCFRLSLARTAQWLWSAGLQDGAEEFAPLAPADVAPAIEQTAWGPARRLRPPLAMAGAEMAWALPAAPLGSSPAEWSR